MQYRADDLHTDRRANAVLVPQLGEGRDHFLRIILRLDDSGRRQQLEILKQNTVGLGSKALSVPDRSKRKHMRVGPYSVVQASKRLEMRVWNLVHGRLPLLRDLHEQRERELRV